MAVPFIISYAGLHNPFYRAGYEITLIYIAAADIRKGTVKIVEVIHELSGDEFEDCISPFWSKH